MAYFDEQEEPTFDAITATSKLCIEACNVRLQKPNWNAYLRSELILAEEHKFMTAYENAKNKKERSIILREHRENGQAVKTIVNLIANVAKDQSVRYLLTLLDDMFQEENSRVEMFHKAARQHNKSAYEWFIGLLQRQDSFITSCIITKLAVFCSSHRYMNGCELHYYFSFLKGQLRTRNDYINTTARCLQMMLKISEYREPFVEANGIQTILSALSTKANFQLQYQLTFALWCITFTPRIATKAVTLGAIQILGDLLSENSKEKVIRIILATFVNILKKIEDKKTKRTAALQMVQCKTIRALEQMEAKKSEDPELQEDIQFLKEELHLSVHDLSSFDEYSSEVLSGRLHWSPVHKSDQFWRENASRLNENNFELVKILIRLLEHNENSLAVCVAAHDIGEYVRYYPRGKIVLEQLQGKQAVMKLLTATDSNIRYHALLAVQKLMVQNWEYLGRQVNTENN